MLTDKQAHFAKDSEGNESDPGKTNVATSQSGSGRTWQRLDCLDRQRLIDVDGEN